MQSAYIAARGQPRVKAVLLAEFQPQLHVTAVKLVTGDIQTDAFFVTS
jgi:hypothetical protein